MHPLLITVAMLALIGLTAHGIERRSADRNLLHHRVVTQMDLSRELRNSLEEEVYTATIIKPRSSTGGVSEPSKKSDPPKTTRPKKQILALPTRLTLRPLIGQSSGRRETYKELAAELMRTLYGEFDFFNGVAGVEELILNRLEEQLQSHPGGGLICGMRQLPTTPEQLAAVPMGDDRVQTIWSKMVRGSDLEGYRSLLPYISMNKTKKINVVFAPLPLLRALFGESKDAEKIAFVRDTTLRAIREQLEEGEEADGQELINAVKMAVESAEKFEEVRGLLSYELKNPNERVTVEATQGGLHRQRTFQNPID